MRTGPFLALPLAVALAACGGARPGEQADAALDAADDAAPADAGPQVDAGPWGTAGARVIHSRQVRPIPITDSPNVTLASVTIVLRARSVAGGVEVRVGRVESVSDGGLAAGYADRLTPVAVLAEVGTVYDAPNGPRRPFATQVPALWSLDLVPGQPALPIHNATFRGSLDAMDVPTSSEPALGGTVEGCFTPAEAEQIYLEVLSMNLKQLIEGSGGMLDVDCTGSGSLDGYAFEVRFDAAVVELQ